MPAVFMQWRTALVGKVFHACFSRVKRSSSATAISRPSPSTSAAELSCHFQLMPNTHMVLSPSWFFGGGAVVGDPFGVVQDVAGLVDAVPQLGQPIEVGQRKSVLGVCADRPQPVGCARHPPTALSVVVPPQSP